MAYRRVRLKARRRIDGDLGSDLSYSAANLNHAVVGRLATGHSTARASTSLAIDVGGRATPVAGHFFTAAHDDPQVCGPHTPADAYDRIRL